MEDRTVLQDGVIDRIMDREKKNSKQFLSLLIVFQVTFILLFGFFVRYDENWTDEELTRNTFQILSQIQSGRSSVSEDSPLRVKDGSKD